MKANARKHDAAWLALLEQRRAATGRGDISPAPKGEATRARKRSRARVRHVTGRMNRLEARYAGHLDEQVALGEIDSWAFEPEKFRLGEKCYYTPDFRVVDSDGFVSFRDTKGGREWEDARIKAKTAATIHPYPFAFVTQAKDGGWDLEWFESPDMRKAE